LSQPHYDGVAWGSQLAQRHENLEEEDEGEAHEKDEAEKEEESEDK